MQQIISNNLTYWTDVDKTAATSLYNPLSIVELVALPFFANWIVGFTMAEGSFGTKSNGESFFQIG